ncbi:MAG TPA: ABC transporter permease subunit [Clostridiaceae bacterium]
MKSFLNLVSIENFKMWKRLSTKVMLIVLVGIILLAFGIMKYYNVSQNISTDNKVSATWKEDTQKQLEGDKLALAQLEKDTSAKKNEQIKSLKKAIAQEEYIVAHDIKPETKQNVWSKISTNNFSQIIALLLIIACSANVAGEFTEGTMKMMIPRPYSRSQILTAKFIASLFYGIVLLGVTFILSFLLTGLLSGFNNLGAKEMLWTGSSIVYIPAVIRTLIIYALDLLQILVYVIFAFALSAIFRSRSIATGFSLFMLLAGANLISFLSSLFSWGKFLPFATPTLSFYIITDIQNTTLGFALIMSAIYSVIFLIAGYYTFNKRDIQ